MTAEKFVFRRGMADDAPGLSALAFRSKAHWGYPEEWMEVWRGDLSLSAEYVENNEVWLVFEQTRLVGFYGVELRGHNAWLQHLWVEPSRVRRGLGRMLFQHACECARSYGCQVIELIADPNAEAFYQRMGMNRTGEEFRRVFDTPRILPRMRLQFEG